MRPGAVVALLYWVSPTPSHVTRLGRPCPGDICTCICCVMHMLAACAAAPREIGTCLLRFHTCGCVPTDHCCGVTHLAGPAAGAFTVVALLQPGGGYLAGRRSQCAMYSLPLRSLCRCSRRQSARRDPAVPCVLCSARTRASASQAHTSRCRVWPLHRVHGLASRAVYKET